MTSAFHCKNRDGLLLSLEKHWTESFHFDIIWQPFPCVLVDQNGALGFLGVFFNPGCDIDSIPYAGIRGTMLRSRIPRDDATGCDPNPNLDLGFFLSCLFHIKAFEQLDHFDGSPHSVLPVTVVMNWC